MILTVASHPFLLNPLLQVKIYLPSLELSQHVWNKTESLELSQHVCNKTESLELSHVWNKTEPLKLSQQKEQIIILIIFNGKKSW